MDEGKGARKSDFITETPTRNEQPSKRAQDLPKKPRSAIKKDLIAFLGDGRRTPSIPCAWRLRDERRHTRPQAHAVAEIGIVGQVARGCLGRGANAALDEAEAWGVLIPMR